MKLFRKLVFFKPVFVVSFLGSFAGCSGGEGVPSISDLDRQTPHLPFNPNLEADPLRARAEDYASRFSVTCSSAHECPESVGMLLEYSVSSSSILSSRCTGTLVAPDVFMTASHCLPADLRRAGASCAGRIRLIFPEISPQIRYTNAGCGNVISASEIDENSRREGEILEHSPDIAFLRLSAPVLRQAARVNQQGMTDGMEVRVAKVDSRRDLVSGEDFSSGYATIQTVNCRVSHRTVVFPQINDSAFPFTSLTQCDLHQGNSGAPVIDPIGEVRGVVYAVRRERRQEDPSLGGFQGAQFFRLPNGPFSLATNLACIQVPGIERQDPMPQACENSRISVEDIQQARRQFGSREEVSESLSHRVQPLFDQWVNRNSTSFRWDLEAVYAVYPYVGERTNALNRLIYYQSDAFRNGSYFHARRWYFFPKPSCILRSSLSPPNERIQSLPFWVGGTLDELDSNFQLDIRLFGPVFHEGVAGYDLATLSARGQSQIRLRIPEAGRSPGAVVYEGQIPICGN